MPGLRVLLADDQPMVRGAARLMPEADGHEIVGEAGDGGEAVPAALRVGATGFLLENAGRTCSPRPSAPPPTTGRSSRRR